jgi:hypothetical protein
MKNVLMYFLNFMMQMIKFLKPWVIHDNLRQKVSLHNPTHISEFVQYGMNLLYNKNMIDLIFVCHAVRHLANMLDCVNTPKR